MEGRVLHFFYSLAGPGACIQCAIKENMNYELGTSKNSLNWNLAKPQASGIQSP